MLVAMLLPQALLPQALLGAQPHAPTLTRLPLQTSRFSAEPDWTATLSGVGSVWGVKSGCDAVGAPFATEEMGVDALCEANKEQPLQSSGVLERYQHMSLSLHHFRLKQPYALQLMKSAQLHWPGLQRRMPAVLMSEEQKPTQAYKVKVYGARLDSTVAGFDNDITSERADEDHQIAFKDGVSLMQSGNYKQASSAFTKAITSVPGGSGSRLGGQYAIWLAQALQAGGEKQKAVGLLQQCNAHPDRDVRKIADSVLYIMQAPELKLGEENFVKIPKLDETAMEFRRKRGPVQKKDPPPEKYSLEWYILEGKRRANKTQASSDGSLAPLALTAAAIVAATAALLFANPNGPS